MNEFNLNEFVDDFYDPIAKRKTQGTWTFSTPDTADTLILPVIEKLNKCGLNTSFSCAGFSYPGHINEDTFKNLLGIYYINE
jgi:hypothetical protein